MSVTYSSMLDCSLQDRHQRRMALVDFATAFENEPAENKAAHAAALLAQGFIPDATLNAFSLPACFNCNACIPIRIDLRRFAIQGELGRIFRRNADLTLVHGNRFSGLDRVVGNNPAASLAKAYFMGRFGYSASFDAHDFLKQFMDVPGFTPRHLMLFHPGTDRADPRLLGCLIYHEAQGGDAGVAYGTMFFYDLNERKRGLGHYMMLKSIQLLKARGISHLYMGYWTPHSSAYSWKAKYLPAELRIDGGWRRFDTPAALRALRGENLPAYPAQRFAALTAGTRIR